MPLALDSKWRRGERLLTMGERERERELIVFRSFYPLPYKSRGRWAPVGAVGAGGGVLAGNRTDGEYIIWTGSQLESPN